jgi:hypothetical protein
MWQLQVSSAAAEDEQWVFCLSRSMLGFRFILDCLSSAKLCNFVLVSYCSSTFHFYTLFLPQVFIARI